MYYKFLCDANIVTSPRDLSSTLVAMMSLLFKQSILVDPNKPCRSDLFIISQEKIQLGIKLEFLEEN